jgi:hypothetical protein
VKTAKRRQELEEARDSFEVGLKNGPTTVRNGGSKFISQPMIKFTGSRVLNMPLWTIGWTVPRYC